MTTRRCSRGWSPTATSQSLQLRRIAPTVVDLHARRWRGCSRCCAHAGYAPAAEAADGAVITLGVRAAARAVPPAGPRHPAAERRWSPAPHLAELVRRIRSGDTLTELSHRVQPIVQQVPGVTSATTMALLRQAIREGRRVLLGSRRTGRHRVAAHDPADLAGRRLRAWARIGDASGCSPSRCTGSPR